MNLVNYDPEDSDPAHTRRRLTISAQTSSSTVQAPPIRSPKSPTKPAAARKQGVRNPHASSSLPPTSASPPPRPVTPTLALGAFDSSGLIMASPILPSTPTLPSPASELLPAERNMIILAIQEQVDWADVAAKSGLSVDKAMKWWMKASAEIARRA